MNPFSKKGEFLYQDKDLKQMLKDGKPKPGLTKDEKIVFDFDKFARKYSIGGSEKSGQSKQSKTQKFMFNKKKNKKEKIQDEIKLDQILKDKQNKEDLENFEDYDKIDTSRPLMDNGVEMTKTVKIKERRDKKSKILLKKSSAEEINMKKSVNDKISTIEMSKTVKELDDQEQQICDLCCRNRPVFVVETDNMIKRMPERYLSPLLKSLKQDFQKNRMYLKYLRIKTNFITPCQCPKKQVHSYCQTAKVVRQQKIYCEDCGAYYHLFVKGEKLCSSHLQTVFGRYICYFIMLIIFAQCTLLIDSLLKQNHRYKYKDTEFGERDQDKDGIMDSKDSAIFSFNDIQNWIVMIPLTVVMAFIMVWCFYFRFMKAVMSRRKLIWVEVLDSKNSEIYVSRLQAKQNLCLICEETSNVRSYNQLFDKYWYRKREIQYIDAIKQLDQTYTQNNLQEFKSNSGNTHTNQTTNSEKDEKMQLIGLQHKQQMEIERVRGKSLASIPEGSKQSMNFEVNIAIQKQNQEKESKEGIQLSSNIDDTQKENNVYSRDIARINKDIQKSKIKAKIKQQREINENQLNERKKSIESEQYEFGAKSTALVPTKERKRTMSLMENNFLFNKKQNLENKKLIQLKQIEEDKNKKEKEAARLQKEKEQKELQEIERVRQMSFISFKPQVLSKQDINLIKHVKELNEKIEAVEYIEEDESEDEPAEYDEEVKESDKQEEAAQVLQVPAKEEVKFKNYKFSMASPMKQVEQEPKAELSSSHQDYFTVEQFEHEDQKKSAEFSKSDMQNEPGDLSKSQAEDLNVVDDDRVSSGDTKQNLNMIGTEIQPQLENDDSEKAKANESNNTSGPISRHQIQESIQEVQEYDQQDVQSYIPIIWKKYDNNDIQFLDRFETQAFMSEICAKVDEKMPTPKDFKKIYDKYQNQEGFMDYSNIHSFVMAIISCQQKKGSLFQNE